MPTEISQYHVRRSTWIAAPPDVVWEEMTAFERMRRWYGTGHTLTAYEPRVGGIVETTVELDGEPHRFRGEILTFEPGRELTFEQLWVGSDWQGPTMVTIRLSWWTGARSSSSSTTATSDSAAVRASTSTASSRAGRLGRSMPSATSSASDLAFSALADPTRRRVLELLRDREELTAGELAVAFPKVSRPAVSKHLRILRDAGLVTATQVGRTWRYRLNPEPLAAIHDAWLSTFVPLFDESLRRLKIRAESRHRSGSPES